MARLPISPPLNLIFVPFEYVVLLRTLTSAHPPPRIPARLCAGSGRDWCGRGGSQRRSGWLGKPRYAIAFACHVDLFVSLIPDPHSSPSLCLGCRLVQSLSTPTLWCCFTPMTTAGTRCRWPCPRRVALSSRGMASPLCCSAWVVGVPVVSLVHARARWSPLSE